MNSEMIPWHSLCVHNFLMMMVIASSILYCAMCKPLEVSSEDSHSSNIFLKHNTHKYQLIPPVLKSNPVVLVSKNLITRNITSDFVKNEINQRGSASSMNSKKDMPFCPFTFSDSDERVNIIKDVPTDEVLMDKLQAVLGPDLGGMEMGGQWKPSNCISQEKTAIIVPFRTRVDNLRGFLLNLHPFLQEQNLDYRIFVVEQAGDQLSNVGMLKNIGFVEVSKLYNCDCFLFHDVCLIPEEKSIPYKCSKHPLHLAGAVSSYGYKMPYLDYFGGLISLRSDQFLKINGYSNEFWGWGQEDDDLFFRIGKHDLKGEHFHGRFFKLNHEEGSNPEWQKRLEYGKSHYNTSGLDTLKYNLLGVGLTKLYTWIYVELPEPN